jgi:hypothetical protein
MNWKNTAYLFLAFALPLLLILAGIVAEITIPWLYVGSIVWFVMALLLYISAYQI